jgi:nitroimidazol reductase NimA-like FMN-containing flavoprotein (pyridoxamine 5'-phosphate oxidase superfamily)
MRMTTKPMTIIELSRQAGLQLLAEHHIGRIAFAFRDRVDIEPISYVFADGWIYARTSPGTKLTTIEHHPYVAFEVDEIRSATDWRSVVVHGTIYFIDPERSDVDRALHTGALQHLRSVDPSALTDEDAAPHRRQLLRIYVDEVVARSARAL